MSLRISSEGRLWFSDNGYIDAFVASEALLKRVLLQAFHGSQIPQVGHRKDYGDLEGCDVKLTTFWDHTLTVQELEYVNIAHDGAFVSNADRHKFDSRKPPQCWTCGVPDTFEHKYRECSKFEAILQRFPTLVQQWPNLPDSFVLHGLVPSNPWRSLVYEALLALENHVSNFEFAPEAGVVHCFADGSCSNPTVEEDSLAAWAVVQPGRGTISCGPLAVFNRVLLKQKQQRPSQPRYGVNHIGAQSISGQTVRMWWIITDNCCKDRLGQLTLNTQTYGNR